MSLIDDVKRDLEAGTDHLWVAESRIRRISALEAALLAADEMATDFMITIDNIRDAAKTDVRWQGVADKLAPRLSTYRNAVEGK